MAPYASRSELSKGRQYDEPPDPMRTSFERDRDRILHSSAFRRLGYKTQVFLNQEGDNNRTRLSHSLEVSQVARSLSTSLASNETLCEVLALAHDIGHPPFGHRGEVALDELMKEHGGYRHNAQVLRVVDRLERRSPNYPGLNLTREVRESLLKHESDEDWPFDLKPRPARPCLEAQIVDLADSTAYNKHDLEDGLLASMFAEELVESEVCLWRDARAVVEKRYPGYLDESTDAGLRIFRIANEVMGLCITDLFQATRERLEWVAPTSPNDVKQAKRLLVGHGDVMGKKVAELHRFLYSRFYRHEHLQRFLTFARSVLTGLFEAYRNEPKLLGSWYQEWADEVGLERSVCDYIAGMTDRFALGQHEQLVGPLPGGFSPHGLVR